MGFNYFDGWTHRKPSFVLRQPVLESSLGWCWWRRGWFALFRLQQHNALLQVEESRFTRGARRCWRLLEVSVGVVEVGADINVVCVVDLNQNVAGLRGDLKKSFLQVVLRLFIILVRPGATQVNVVPKSRRHASHLFNSLHSWHSSLITIFNFTLYRFGVNDTTIK